MSNKLAIQIFAENPIAAEICREWYLNKMKKAMVEDSMAEEFQEVMLKRGIEDHLLAIMLDDLPRGFFDVLDAHNIVIQISVLALEHELFNYSIFYLIGEVWELGELSSPIKGRVNCERAAVEKAFSMLT